MKSVLCYPIHNGAAGQYRVVEPYSKLDGFEIDTTGIFDFDRAMNHDAVLFHMASAKELVPAITELKAAGKKVVVDIDDDFTAIPHWHPSFKHYRNSCGDMLEIVRMADAVHVSTPQIAVKLSHPCTVILPNAINLGKYFGNPRIKLRQKYGIDPDAKVVMWSGGAQHEEDLKLIAETVYHLTDDPHTVFVFVANDVWVRSLGAQLGDGIVATGWIPFNQYHEYYAMADLALAPLIKNDFNEAKSELRLLESAAWGVPCLCSDGAPYRRFFRNSSGGCAFVYGESMAAWTRKAKDLLEDDTRRKKIGSKAEICAKNQYNLEAINTLRIEWWNKFLVNNKARRSGDDRALGNEKTNP